MRVLGQKVGRANVDVREVASPAAGDADFFGHTLCMVQQQHSQATLAGQACTVKARRACADDGDVKVLHMPVCFPEVDLRRNSSWERPSIEAHCRDAATLRVKERSFA